MGLQAVFFDMGGTLERVWYTTEQRVKAAAGMRNMLISGGIELQMPEADFYRTLTAGYRRYHRWSVESMQELPPFRVWSDFILAGLSIDPSRLEPIAEELMLYLETNFFQRELRPEAPQALEAVRKMGLKIGLISNVCSRGLMRENLSAYGIREYFDPIILSSEYGRRKPDPAIFHYSARLANVPTSACVHVGDRVARDILGARKAGFGLTVQIINDFDHGEKDEGPSPEAVIKQLTDLIPLLEERSHKPAGSARHDHAIRALLFDAGDILYYRPDRGRNMRCFLETLGLEDKEISATERDSLKKQVYHGHISQAAYQEAFLKLYGITDPELIERGQSMMDADDNSITFFEGVSETLRALKDQGFLLGVITDTAMPIHIKLKWFEQGGFGDVWDSLISSADLGMQKPDPRIYQAALTQLGLRVDEAVFVGHLQEELQGARAVGMKTIAFNYQPEAQADFYIGKFCELLEVPVIADQRIGMNG